MFYVPKFEDVKEGARYNPLLRDRLITGLSMTCRGEFSFIIAAFALGKGLISAKIYAAIVWAVLLSCVSSPFMLLRYDEYVCPIAFSQSRDSMWTHSLLILFFQPYQVLQQATA